jgi:hypothetical protein
MKRVLLLAILAAGFANGADLYVPSQYTTIQAGIDAATTGDTVWVADGTYTGTGNKELTWSGAVKHITVRSVNGANNCIIDCQGSGRGFYFYNTGQNSSDLIQGFTIRNGNVSDDGGVFCWNSSPSITNCTISGNTDTCGVGG